MSLLRLNNFLLCRPFRAGDSQTGTIYGRKILDLRKFNRALTRLANWIQHLIQHLIASVLLC